MSETKHTPGPWKATPIAQGTGDFCIHAKGVPWQLAYLAESSQIEWPIEANARLIAAAPDMLEALNVAMETLKAFDPGDPTTETGWKHDELCNAWAFCRVAIAKATGEPS